ncbi:MAG: proton-conducting transporter membrane subunit [Lentisphaeria bacterium]|nr:proton-conducting transporter membrane subunit [Lentisphaeria bacterium]
MMEYPPHIITILLATALAAVSGLPGLFIARRSSAGQRISIVMMACAAVLGVGAALAGLRSGPTVALVFPWPAWGEQATVAVDALSAFFLVPVFAMGGLGAVYGWGYWRQESHIANGRKLRLFWGLTIAGMATLVVARDGLTFLMGWETMALSAYFLVSAEDRVSEVRGSGWLYLIATHLGTLGLFAMFALLRMAAGSFALSPPHIGQTGLGLSTAIFLLALLGFGLKAGIMPLHFWLPSAHANAPSHVSALLSGVMLKMGVYGLIRVTWLLPDPPLVWGAFLLLLGVVSGILGVVFAIGQHDLKRLLAYHSVENIGIIVMGLGLAMIGRSLGRGDLVWLGLAGCLLHVWNHGLFKALLFLGAGSVVHAARTRQIDQLGGLARRMPWTAGLFMIGAAAICGLPPLNGFISELLVYLGLLRTTGIDPGPSLAWAAVAAPALAMIGTLALACFVKAYGAIFLGSPRGAAAERAHESPVSMLAPMGILALGCAWIGLVPLAVAPRIDRAVGVWADGAASGELQVASLAPLAEVGTMGVALLLMAGAGAWLLARRMRAVDAPRVVTWDCGYARPSSRMQYTASSFAQTLVGLFGWVLHPHRHGDGVTGIFPGPARFDSHVDDVVLDGKILPAARSAQRWLARIRGIQQGLTHHYMLYILLTVVAMLVSIMPVKDLLTRLFSR